MGYETIHVQTNVKVYSKSRNKYIYHLQRHDKVPNAGHPVVTVFEETKQTTRQQSTDKSDAVGEPVSTKNDGLSTPDRLIPTRRQ
jgi:hypothetical protein